MITIREDGLISAQPYFIKFRFFLENYGFSLRQLQVYPLCHTYLRLSHMRAGDRWACVPSHEFLSAKRPLPAWHAPKARGPAKMENGLRADRSEALPLMFRHAYRENRSSVGVFPRYLFMVVAKWL